MNLIIQVFLSVLVFGGLIIFLVILLRKLFSPKKISTLIALTKSGNYKSAINLAKDILNRDKDNIEAHFYLGESYFYQGKNELALIEYKRAEAKGNYAKIDEKLLREKLGELYIKTKNIDEALKEYILLAKKFSSNYLYFFKAGELFEQKEMIPQAVRYYNDTLKLEPNYQPATTNLGILLYRGKSYLEAKDFLEKAISKDPSNFKAYFYLGMLEKKNNNFKGALKYFEKSLRDKEYRIRSLMERGILLMVQGNYDDAVIDLDRALKSCENEDNIKLNLRYILASCYEKKRNITDAITLWEQIYSINSGFKDVSEKLSEYQDLRMDDRMKDFLTATDVDFIDMCKGLITGMGLNIMETDIISRDSIEYFCLEPDAKWRNMKKRPKLIHLTRKNTPVEESVIRNMNEKMREKSVIRAVIITSSSFSKNAMLYAKERPIELIDKNGLQELLKKVSM